MEKNIMIIIWNYFLLFICNLGLSSSIVWVLEDMKTESVFTLINFIYLVINYSIKTLKD